MGYGRFLSGTGSVLVTDATFCPPSQEKSGDIINDELDKSDKLEYMLPWSGRLRFFGPLETFQLMGFKLKPVIEEVLLSTEAPKSVSGCGVSFPLLHKGASAGGCHTCLPLMSQQNVGAASESTNYQCRCVPFSLPH